MESLLKRLLSFRSQLSKLEERVLMYFVEHPESIIRYNLSELSEQIFVSTATVSRTCKKLGFDGYQELKYTITTHYDLQASQMTEQKAASPSVQDHLSRFEQEFTKGIKDLGQGINQELIHLIKKSRHVEFFGVGGSLPLSIEGARKFTFSNRIATARSDWDELRIVADNLTSEDLAIIISLSGETMLIIEYAELLKERQVPILAVTGNANSRLNDLASITLTSPQQTVYYEEIDMSSRFLLSLILDLIVLELLN